MERDKNLINLKEASAISGYSADYVGQLIRQGKIPGKQVACNVQWMTTKEAVLGYKQGDGQKGKTSKFSKYLETKKQRFGFEMEVYKLFFKTFKTLAPVLLIFIISFFLLIIFFIYNFFPRNDSSPQSSINQANEKIEF
jgi:hypothetical protein